MLRRALAGHALALVATVSTRATAQATTRDMLHVPGRDVTMSLITVGVGDKIAEMFGHTALRVRNTVDGRDTVFNWGEFDMSQPHFILHFMRGLNLYRLGGAPMDSLLQDSRSKNRSVTEQELALTSEQRDSIISIIRVNAEPQNVVYRYDYFVDNCATRPRDILDRVLGGQLRDGADSLTAASYRDHALRLMQSDKPLVVGVDIVFVVAGLSALALVAHLVLLSRQANLALIGLSLPPTAALAYIVATSRHVARYVVE